MKGGGGRPVASVEWLGHFYIGQADHPDLVGTFRFEGMWSCCHAPVRVHGLVVCNQSTLDEWKALHG